ncbi:ComEC/Rec2 family competence protein [Marinilactibacillus sp. Marseille-P9653]|uniref:ComEC/Rec2 family competence protein n=1 Tax=Marinilactibacillus sp. Marseille-P9653 TaxID=2866583 RepID=UPI001CE48D53|nr:MBL fold metallo-hydrolase [Marinilactibacillus sp. Marseille-P9653]
MVRKKKMTKKQKQQRIQVSVTAFLIALAFFIGLFFGDNPYDANYFADKWQELTREWAMYIPSSEPESSSNGTIRFFDVGQGSSTLYQSEDGTNIVIDTGRYDDSDKRIVSYLDKYIGTGGKIDLLIFTHNDADHIGNGDLVLEYFQVDEVWMNGVDHTTRVYEKLLDAISESDANYYEPKAGETKDIGPFKIEVLNPQEDNRTTDHNEESIVTRTTISKTSVMNSGDASSTVEKQIVEQYRNLKAEVMLIGHHGSKDSNSTEWLNAVDPKVAIIQAGLNNSYGHPHKETLERINHQGIPLYSTMEEGTVTIAVEEDGTFSINKEQP